jgi:DNA-binding transcriptional LysR family regulator
MEWLNYHHLLYFWTVARKGSIARACEGLCLAQPTISRQLRALEENLGEKLFALQGRNLVLTEVGQARLWLCRRDILPWKRAQGMCSRAVPAIIRMRIVTKTDAGNDFVASNGLQCDDASGRLSCVIQRAA